MNENEVVKRIDLFLKRFRPCVFRRQLVDLQATFVNNEIIVEELNKEIHKIDIFKEIFRARHYSDLNIWRIIFSRAKNHINCEFKGGEDAVDEVLKYCSFLIEDEYERWGDVSDKMISVDELKLWARMTYTDIINAAKAQHLEFCIRVPEDSSVFVYDIDSVEYHHLYDFNYKSSNKEFSEMPFGPELQQSLRFLILSYDDAVQAITGNTIRVSRFRMAYALCLDLFPDEYSGKISPNAAPLFLDKYSGDRKIGYFFGVNDSKVKHVFSEASGYSPLPTAINVSRENIYIRGRVLRSYIRSDAFEKVYKRNLGRYMRLLDEDGARDNGIRDEIKVAVKDLEKGGHIVTVESIIKYFSDYRVRDKDKFSIIKSVDKSSKLVTFETLSGIKVLNEYALRKRLERLKLTENEVLKKIAEFNDFFSLVNS